MSNTVLGLVAVYLSAEEPEAQSSSGTTTVGFIIIVGLLVVGYLVGHYRLPGRALRAFRRLVRRRPRVRSERPGLPPFKHSSELLQFPESRFEHAPTRGIVLEQVRIRNVRGIDSVHIDLTGGDLLGGNWACFAGINGTGKSSILQSIALLLLGDRLAGDVGFERVSALRRRTSDGETLDAEIAGLVSIGGERRVLYLPINQYGIDQDRLRDVQHYRQMQDTWERIHDTNVIIGLGATRTASESASDPNQGRLPDPRRVLTLFDSTAQVAGVKKLIEEPSTYRRAGDLLRELVRAVLGRAVELGTISTKGIDFKLGDGVDLGLDQLPDGYRSTIAWLADLCVGWQEKSGGGSLYPEDVSGIVMIDEVALHLHPSLQRDVIPILRGILPSVQFIVTTHSPMVLASFAIDEVRLLEANPFRVIEHTDREIIGMTMDDIYSWLLETPPQSKVIESMDEDDRDVARYLYQSQDVDREEAEYLSAIRKERVQEFRRKQSDAGPAPGVES